ncbi:MAG: DNRLRE domain-containing protein [Chloroflexi bacterium]|nr:DNRLRE domain-containing protein [Chloroflexota bacterium]
MSIRFGQALILSICTGIMLMACNGQAGPPVRPATEPASSPTPTLVSTPPVVAATNLPPTAAAETLEPQTVTLTSNKDNTLYEVEQGFLSNGSGQHFFAGKSAAGPVRRAVIAFNIAGKVPVGSTITKVALTLNVSRTQSEGQVVALHRLLADWGEGASDTTGNEGSGVPASPGDATWIYRSFDTDPWGEPGGDFQPIASGSITVAGLEKYSWGSTTAMVADVQMWLDIPVNNFGWLLKGNEEEVRTTKRFDSRENESPENRPTLTITFVPRGSP